MSSNQISEGPNPAAEDLSPDRGKVTFPVGHAVAQFTVLIRDDQVRIITDLPPHLELFAVQLHLTPSY